MSFHRAKCSAAFCCRYTTCIFLIGLMGKAREAVLAGEYEAFYQDWMNSPAANDDY